MNIVQKMLARHGTAAEDIAHMISLLMTEARVPDHPALVEGEIVTASLSEAESLLWWHLQIQRLVVLWAHRLSETAL